MRPGQNIVSANAGTTCSLLSMAGTSMATPIMAGTAALVRQYFRLGYYPTGAATGANAMRPSAALLKAVLLNSAVPVRVNA
jgi:subtilisin family serine protease